MVIVVHPLSAWITNLPFLDFGIYYSEKAYCTKGLWRYQNILLLWYVYLKPNRIDNVDHPFQLTQSNREQLTLKNVEFEAAGLYNCEASTDTPIFTKASADEQVHVYCKYCCLRNWNISFKQTNINNSFRFSSPECSATNTISEGSILCWGKFDSELFDIKNSAGTTHNVVDKWEKGEFQLP